MLAGAGSSVAGPSAGWRRGVVIPGRSRKGGRTLSGKRSGVGVADRPVVGGLVSPGVGQKGARGAFGQRALVPGLGQEGSRWLFGRWALREGRVGGVTGRPEALRSLRGEASSGRGLVG